ncbi:MAG: hypothetical protein U0414_14605 [Polyangiaceae bacterium]
MKKILLEIIRLLWKFAKLVLWKWIKPMLIPILLGAVAIAIFIVVVGLLLAGSC